MIAVALTKREASLIERALKAYVPTQRYDEGDAENVLQMLAPPTLNAATLEGVGSCG
jgi:hypothetical protein